MKMRLAFLGVVTVFFGILGIPAQDDALRTEPAGAPDEQKIKVQTELMEVRAVVMDKDGRIIENLKKEDFELVENDEPQEISFFSISQIESERSKPVAVGDAGEDSTSEMKSMQERLREPPIRTTLIFVDNLHLSFSSLNRVKSAIRRFIKEQLSDQDMVALATSAQTLGIAQQFTRDRDLLNYGIEQIRLGTFRQESGFTPELAVSVLAGHDDAFKLATSIEARETNTDCCDVLLNLARNHALRILDEDSVSRASTLSTLRGFAEQMMNLPGKRMIVIFSDGFTMRSRDGTINSSEIRKVVDRAVRSGVVIYSIDAKGLQAPLSIDASRNMPSYPGNNWPSVDYMNEYCRQMDEGGQSAPECHPCGASRPDPRCAFAPDPGQWSYYLNRSDREDLNGIYSLAEETGGKLYNDTNDLGGALDQAFDANRYYYVLSYYLPARSDKSGFRKIQVRVRNHPEYTVRTARGFAPLDLTAETEGESVETPQKQLIRAMNAPLPVTEIGVSARADFLETDSDEKQVSLTVCFDGDQFQYREQDQRSAFELEILYVVYDSSGKQVEGVSARVEGNLSQDRLEQAKTSGYRFARRLTLDPGLYQVRIGVREEGTHRMGTASAWVDVPKLAPDKLEMSSLILSNPLDIDAPETEGINVSGLEQIKMVQGIPLFGRGDFFDYSFRVHQGAESFLLPDLKWMPELYRRGELIRHGEWVAISPESEDIDAKGWFDVYGEMDIGEFDPGVYELRISVKDSRSDNSVQRTAVFSVE